jgi:hypothetical protein
MLYVFGYGSLINVNNTTEFMNKDKKIIIPLTLKNMKRSFCVYGFKEIYLGVIEQENSLCNGLLISISNSELEMLKIREKYYDLKEMDISNILFNYNKKILFNKDDKIVLFYPKKEYIINKYDKNISKKYLQICVNGCIKYGIVFLYDFISQTFNS